MDYDTINDLAILRLSPDLLIQLQSNVKPTRVALPTPATSSQKGEHDKTHKHELIDNYIPVVQISSTPPTGSSQFHTQATQLLSTPITAHTDLSTIDRSGTLNGLRSIPCVPKSPLARKANLDDDLYRQSGLSSPMDFFSSRTSGYDADCDEASEEVKESIECEQLSEREVVKLMKSLKSINAELRRHNRLLRLITRQMHRVRRKSVRVRSRFPRTSKRLRARGSVVDVDVE
ncbi:hypothetical protein N7481_013261 [Penicillium waksmanii]|uniref:uncharacterized protein n=1 Tax=Penicillium waksmanii TaxID=69791 RepID=UPI002548EA2E|nr:uncharacterized protein N7481_013261 [Penicillium waksmanii]KAJ5966547.1 hypothetical protein N7481_013261 [Penicillium waksmanii]